jgi:subtilisin family serine protease
MFFNSNGLPLAPGDFLMATITVPPLSKPDFTAADCVITGVSLGGSTTFCGTSAAAPHAAAIAALALDAQPDLTAAQLRAAMTASAIGIGAAIDSGAGIVMAPGTVNAACEYSANGPPLAASAAGSVTVSIQAGRNCPWSLIGLPNWITGAGAISGTGPATVILALAANTGAVRTAMLSLNAGTLSTGASASITQSAPEPHIRTPERWPMRRPGRATARETTSPGEAFSAAAPVVQR